MANILGNPTFFSDKARENSVLANNATLTSAPVVANPILRYRKDALALVDFPLDPTTPFTGASVDGIATFNYVSSSAVAVGGVADIPNNYQLLGRDNVVHMSGPAACTDGISVGQTIAAGTVTATAPAS